MNVANWKEANSYEKFLRLQSIDYTSCGSGIIEINVSLLKATIFHLVKDTFNLIGGIFTVK